VKFTPKKAINPNTNQTSNCRIKIPLASKLNLGAFWAQTFHKNDLIISKSGQFSLPLNFM